MDNFVKSYMGGDNPLVKEVNMMGLKMLDIEWSNKFEGGKQERNMLIRHLKKSGYLCGMFDLYFIPTHEFFK